MGIPRTTDFERYAKCCKELTASEERVRALERIMKGADAADENRERKLRQQEERVRVLSEALYCIDNTPPSVMTSEHTWDWFVTLIRDMQKQARQALGDSHE